MYLGRLEGDNLDNIFLSQLNLLCLVWKQPHLNSEEKGRNTHTQRTLASYTDLLSEFLKFLTPWLKDRIIANDMFYTYKYWC